jgi:predicted ATP-dependent serine protease
MDQFSCAHQQRRSRGPCRGCGGWHSLSQGTSNNGGKDASTIMPSRESTKNKPGSVLSNVEIEPTPLLSLEGGDETNGQF